jgi:hypothetical protein
VLGKRLNGQRRQCQIDTVNISEAVVLGPGSCLWFEIFKLKRMARSVNGRLVFSRGPKAVMSSIRQSKRWTFSPHTSLRTMFSLMEQLFTCLRHFKEAYVL